MTRRRFYCNRTTNVCRHLCTLAFFCVTPFSLGAEQVLPNAPLTVQPAPPTVPKAISLLQSGDAAGAARMMEQVVRAEPGNGRNWRTLGQAYFRANQLDQALNAFQKAGEVEPDKAPFLKIAAIYARKGEKEEAFLW